MSWGLEFTHWLFSAGEPQKCLVVPNLREGGYANPPIHAFVHQIHPSANTFLQIHNLDYIQKGKCDCRCYLYFAQIVEKAICLITIKQYNSTNSLTPEPCLIKETIWMKSLTYRPRLKRDLWSKFCLGPKIRSWRRHNLESTPKYSADPRSSVFSKCANPLDLWQKIHNPCPF